MSRAAPGWYAWDEGEVRYWDGERWVGEGRSPVDDPTLRELKAIREYLGAIILLLLIPLVAGMIAAAIIYF